MQPHLSRRAAATHRHGRVSGVQLVTFAVISQHPNAMIELNPIRQRIASLIGRLDALRGFL